MDFELPIYILVCICGGLLIWHLLKTTWPGWIGYPFVFLVFQATRDLGIEPLMATILSFSDKATKEGTFINQDNIIKRVTGIEALNAGVLILICYLCLAIGMIIVKIISQKINKKNNKYQITYSRSTVIRGWYISLAFFIIGFLAHLVVIRFLLSSYSISELASTRAVYSNEEAVSNPIFMNARLIGPLMQFGALGMILFYFNKKSFMLGLAGNVLYIFTESIYGGRTRVIVGLLTLLVVYHYGVKPIQKKTLLYATAFLTLVLFSLSVNRFLINFEEGWVFQLIENFTGSERLFQTAWLMNVFPDIIPYTGWINAVGALARIIPSISVPGAKTLYGVIIDNFWGGDNPQFGVGGLNFSTAGELYSWDGYTSLIISSIISGIIFGLVFEGQIKFKGNHFSLLFSSVILCNPYFLGIQSRLPESIGSATYFLVPISLMAALTINLNRNLPLIIIIFIDIYAFLFRRFFGDMLHFDFIKPLIIITLPLIYYYSIRALIIVEERKYLTNKIK